MAATREQREWAARWKSLGGTLTTYAIALIGAALIQPVING